MSTSLYRIKQSIYIAPILQVLDFNLYKVMPLLSLVEQLFRNVQFKRSYKGQQTLTLFIFSCRLNEITTFN